MRILRSVQKPPGPVDNIAFLPLIVYEKKWNYTHKTIEDGFKKVKERWYDTNKMRYKSRVSGEVREKTYDVQRDWIIGPAMLIRKLLRNDVSLEKGDKKIAREFDKDAERVFKKTLTLKEIRTRDGVKQYVWRMEDESKPGQTFRILSDASGELIEMAFPPIKLVRTTRKEIENSKTRGAIVKTRKQTDLQVQGEMRADMNELVMDLDFKGERPKKSLPENMYQSVQKTKSGFRITLKPVPFEEKQVDPVEDPAAFERTLRSTDKIQSEHPKIRKTAKQVTGDHTNPVQKTRNILRWLQENIKPTYEIVGQPATIDVYKQRKGDCAEYAVLFNAFSRASKIPSREVSGYIFDGQRFTMHAWNEVRLGDRWVPVDATRNMIGVPANYFRLNRSDRDVTPHAKFNHAFQFFGSVSVRKFQAGGLTFNAAKDQHRYRVDPESQPEAPYDTVLLDNGWTLNGRITGLEKEDFRMLTTIGRVNLPRDLIASIEPGRRRSKNIFKHPETGISFRAADGWQRIRSKERGAPQTLAYYRNPDTGSALQLKKETPKDNMDLTNYFKRLKKVQKNRVNRYQKINVEKRKQGSRTVLRWTYEGSYNQNATVRVQFQFVKIKKTVYRLITVLYKKRENRIKEILKLIRDHLKIDDE